MFDFRFVRVVGLAAVLLLAWSGLHVAAGEGTEPAVELRWALGAMDTGASAPSAVTRDTQLESGTRLKFLVEPLSPSSVYLLLLDSAGEIHSLYQQSAPTAEGAGQPTYVPPGAHWFELDDKAGSETFFLLASSEPLPGLESLLERYAAADPAAKKDVGSEIVSEIRRLHKAHRNFARPVEKPVMIGGQTRGGPTGPSAIDRLAVEISAERFYGKTITIDH